MQVSRLLGDPATTDQLHDACLLTDISLLQKLDQSPKSGSAPVCLFFPPLLKWWLMGTDETGWGDGCTGHTSVSLRQQGCLCEGPRSCTCGPCSPPASHVYRGLCPYCHNLYSMRGPLLLRVQHHGRAVPVMDHHALCFVTWRC
jgi:hypothetical protein